MFLEVREGRGGWIPVVVRKNRGSQGWCLVVVAELRTIVMVLVELKMVEMGVPRDLVSEMVVVDLRQVLGYLSV